MNTKKKNPWKVAFFTLTATIFVIPIGFYAGLAYLNASHSQKEDQSTTNIKAPSEEYIQTDLSLTKEAFQKMMQTYLGDKLANGKVEVSDDIKISGTQKILGIDVAYALTTQPYVTEAGDLQLKITSINLSHIELPKTIVLSLLSTQVELPDFVEVDANNKLVELKLSELTLPKDIKILAKTCQLQDDKIVFTIFFKPELLKN
ncbi:Uncharacterized protein YpmS [Granulicatella balaenopterae]|uniref:Uncharacterized protein YpmS n=1 Tax=Granulicatella balaenopterae TaxID=137733 RepID=A0A1H9K3M0_9LACT|nr:YpmS family protein [Granulicatella balaenopterae]SEQ93445.1 Uncharacterized protein YpmS [Granulicatella balaenopterae]